MVMTSILPHTSVYFIIVHPLTHLFQAQTPKQQQANKKYAKNIAAARQGKKPAPVKQQPSFKSPLPASWIGKGSECSSVHSG